MAFFGYDPYDYYYTAPPSNHYPHPFYRHRRPQQPTDVFFPAAEPGAVRVRPRRKKAASIPIPVFGPDDAELANVAKVEKKRALPAEEAAVRIQAAARGFVVRKAVRALRAVEKEVEEVGVKVAREAEALRGDARARIAVGEQLMKLLFRLDAVRGAREFRKRVAKRVLTLQDAVDALEQRTLVDAAAAAESDVTAAEESVAAPELPDSANHSGKAEADMEVDGDRAAEGTDETKNGTEQAPEVPESAGHSGEPEPELEMEVDRDRAAEETEETKKGTEQAPEPDATAEDEWEMVTEEPEQAAEAEPQRQEQAGEVSNGKAEAAGGLDAKKLMEMVAALCEQNAQQCAVIGALADRVDALERAVRRVEDVERRRRLAKKLKKEGKGRNQNKCYMD